MSIITKIVTLGTTATLLETGVPEGKVTLLRDASADVFIGGSDVTTANGFRLATTDVLSVTCYQGDALYAIASSGTPTVRVLATRDSAS